MATYATKYRAEFKNTRGHEYQIDIMRRDYSGSVITIKTLCGCVLEIQGAQNGVTAPITKTQLRVSMVDAWDETGASGEKWGDWQEFFTPDATLYKVKLRQKLGVNWQDVWTGYITPDSWHEDLDYRNAITITARDNLGHLKDFSFDMEGDENGLVKIADLLTAAKAKIDFPMGLYIVNGGTGNKVPTANDGVSDIVVTDACVNVSVFDGMDWYEALEQTIEAIGYTIRFVGWDTYHCKPIRSIINPDDNSSGISPSMTVEFYGGTMELDPAVKEISEEQEYGAERSISIPITGDIEYETAQQYRCKTDGNTLPAGGVVHVPEHDAPCNRVLDRGKTRWSNSAYLLDTSQFEPDSFLKRDEGDSWNKYAFLPANQVTDNSASAVLNIFTRTLSLNLTFTFTEHGLTIEDYGTETGKMSDKFYALSQIKYSLVYVRGNLQNKYYDGRTWGNTYQQLTADFDSQNQYQNTFEINVNDDPDFTGGNLFVIFENIIYKCWSSGGQGAYARLASVDVELSGIKLLSGNKVRTINNNAYNVKIERKPLFGALSKPVGFITSENYRKALYYYVSAGSKPAQFPYLVHFTGQTSDNDVPLPVAIHQQILCYYFGAARVLSGRCAPINDAALRFDRVFLYKGTKYVLQGGTFNLFSGIVEGAVLREFAIFDDLWTGTPSWSDSTDYSDGSVSGGGSSSSGGGSSSSGGGGISRESDPVFSASAAAGITSNDITNWNGKSTLPSVDSNDNGKVLKVVSGAWAKGTDSGYTKPSGGIPSSDMTSAVQASLGLADSALQSVPSDYKKVVLCASEAAYQAITNKDSDTLYLIPET